jgi:hypothetical protein
MVLASGFFIMKRVIRLQTQTEKEATAEREEYLIESRLFAEQELVKKKNQLRLIADNVPAPRKHKEINFIIPEPEKLSDLFEEIGLELYAHQEKDRMTYIYKDWQFDIDQYPKMPALLEIEGRSDKSIRVAIDMLALNNNKTWAKGERILIQDIYGLDWYDMRF